MRTQFLRIFLVLLFAPVALFAQNPTKWSLELNTPDSKAGALKSGERILLVLRAEIEPGWHLYALDQQEGGPIPLSIKVADEKLFKFRGIIPSWTLGRPDPLFVVDGKPLETRYYENAASFLIDLESLAETGTGDVALDVRFQLCNDTFCLPPRTKRVSLAGEADVKKPVTGSRSSVPGQVDNQLRTTQRQTDLWSFIWLAISFGAISLLTPCVFPMIPITVSYFMKHSDGDRARTIKLATVYSVGIIATFSLLGMLLAVVFGAAGINLFAANPWVNLFIGALFLFFAFNLFGFYEISIPSGILTRLDSITRSEEGKGSAYLGALLMGLTFTLTSFTCTSPFIGSLLVSTAQGDWKMPLLGMLAFSIVFALPFFVLALAPRLLHSLPRSG
ncbi:MAG TPA: cytochrome c biogenesis protein CcdA, partial [Pyrinomonadaceae bacterium]|nr:cytochrome c biogenesis protein CcdA [Pyrinomonadaceae bacterium]